jgi:hypothetical protein
VATDTVTEWEPGVPLYNPEDFAFWQEIAPMASLKDDLDDCRDGMCGVCPGTEGFIASDAMVWP